MVELVREDDRGEVGRGEREGDDGVGGKVGEGDGEGEGGGDLEGCWAVVRGVAVFWREEC